jgi:hypothetical protein
MDNCGHDEAEHILMLRCVLNPASGIRHGSMWSTDTETHYLRITENSEESQRIRRNKWVHQQTWGIQNEGGLLALSLFQQDK